MPLLGGARYRAFWTCKPCWVQAGNRVMLAAPCNRVGKRHPQRAERPKRMSIPVCMKVLASGLLLGLLAGCASQPSRIPPQSFAPGLSGESPPSAHESQLVNDPSAPTNTPLCGTAAREAMAMAVQNYPQPLAVGGSCVRNACFNTQTGTYIAADGTQRICR